MEEAFLLVYSWTVIVNFQDFKMIFAAGRQESIVGVQVSYCTSDQYIEILIPVQKGIKCSGERPKILRIVSDISSEYDVVFEPISVFRKFN